MLLTERELKLGKICHKRPSEKSARSRSAHLSATSISKEAKALGLNTSTYRHRLRKVADGSMTLDQAKKQPVMTRAEFSSLGATAQRQTKKNDQGSE